MTKSKPIRIRSTHVTYEKDYSAEEVEKDVRNIQELLATAMYEYAKKHKLL